MKTILFLFLFGIAGCGIHIGEDYSPCGYYETPVHYQPEICYNDGCCTWATPGFYSECFETWCYNQFVCGWQLEEQYCYPI